MEEAWNRRIKWELHFPSAFFVEKSITRRIRVSSASSSAMAGCQKVGHIVRKCPEKRTESGKKTGSDKTNWKLKSIPGK